MRNCYATCEAIFRIISGIRGYETVKHDAIQPPQHYSHRSTTDAKSPRQHFCTEHGDSYLKLIRTAIQLSQYQQGLDESLYTNYKLENVPMLLLAYHNDQQYSLKPQVICVVALVCQSAPAEAILLPGRA